MTANTITFRNEIQAALWEDELCGQISDGYWENASPMNHWEVWCDANVIVDPINVGRNFHATKCNYDLNRSELLECVGDRMLVLARLVRRYGLADGQLFNSGSIKDVSEYKGDFWERIRSNVAGRLAALDISTSDLREVAVDATFGLKEMRAELKDMKKIIQNKAC